MTAAGGMTTLEHVREAHAEAQAVLSAVDFTAGADAVAKAAEAAESAVHTFRSLARRYEEGL